MPIDDRTTNRAYKLPNQGNWLGDDVTRLREALAAIDADIAARYTSAQVDALINGVVNGAPGALNTLQELAAALGGDANFSATVLAQLAGKANAAEVYTKAEADGRYVQGQTQAEMVFVATANQAAFSLSTAVINKPSALVSVDGVIQPTSEYSLNQTGTVLTLSEGVPLGTVVRVLVLGVASTNAPGDDTVTTPKLRDAAVTAAKLATGAVSEEALAPGAVTPTKLAQSLTLMTAQAASGTTVQFTGIPSWVRRITVMLDKVSTNSGSFLLLQLGTSAGFVTSGYDTYAGYGGGGGQFQQSVSGFITAINYDSLAQYQLKGSVVFTTMGDNKWIGSGNIATNLQESCAGVVTLPGGLDRLRLTTTNGTDQFDDGTINVLFE